MPEEIDDIEKLSEELKKRIQDKTLRIITIDGLDGSGKTSLAYCLKMKLDLNITIISLDLFLRRNLGKYKLKISMLRNILKEALKSESKRLVIIEGVLIKEIMQKLRRVTKDKVKDPEVYHIYYKVKSPERNFKPFYDAQCEDDLVIDNFLSSPLGVQLLHYHRRFNPCENADIIYIRTEDRPLVQEVSEG